MCPECYCIRNRVTPLFNRMHCLRRHTQYICGNCGRCICANYNKNGLQRWNFPFRSLSVAQLYLRVADHRFKKSCGIYKIIDEKRCFYKIFTNNEDLYLYLKKTGKKCLEMNPIFIIERYKEYPNTKIRRLSLDEACIYCFEKSQIL